MDRVNGCHCQQPPSPVDQQVIDHLKCEVLESLRLILTRSLTPDRHFDFLRSKRILTEEDCEEINHPPSRQRRASKLMDILAQKGAEAYNALCASLQEDRTQMFLLKMLHEDFERRLRLYQELVSHENPPTQGLAPIHPPPLRPPPPPSHHPHHRHHNNRLTPGEHEHRMQHPSPTLHSSSSESCPGYVSRIPCSSPSTLSSPTFPSSQSTMHTVNGSGFSVQSAVSVYGREKEPTRVDDQKPQLNVPAYLQSLVLTKDEAGTPAMKLSDGQPELSHGPTASSMEQQPRILLSNAATLGSSSRTYVDDVSINRSAGDTPLPTPTQDSQASVITGDHAVARRRQHQRLDSRGSLQEMNISLPVVGAGSLVSSSGGSLKPEEIDDTLIDSSVSSESSLFSSIENGSLVPTHSGNGVTRPILCSTALDDQHKALTKCSQDDEKGFVDKSADSCEDGDVSVTHKTCISEPPSDLACLSPAHSTHKKTVVDDLSGPSASQSCDTVSPPRAVTEEDMTEGKEDLTRDKGLQFEGGLSKEARGSVCDKSGRSLHSSQC